MWGYKEIDKKCERVIEADTSNPTSTHSNTILKPMGTYKFARYKEISKKYEKVIAM